MKEDYIEVGKITTHIMAWGKWVEDDFKPDEKELIICITGNPGLPGFYTKFLSTLHETLGEQIPCWVIGQVGHDDPPRNNSKSVPPLRGNEDLFGLAGQLQHKIAFIEKYVPEGVKIHLIGHSIGAYMILELLKIPSIKRKVQHCYLLFPTLERMAVSRNGWLLTTLLLPLKFIALWFFSLFCLLPNVVKIYLIYVYFMLFSIPKEFVGTVLKYATPRVTQKVIYLAGEEMEMVVDLDVETVKANKDMLKFYYGTTDGWVPIKYFEDLKRRVPGVDAELCSHKIAHAFVLRSGPQMARMCADWINEHRVK